MAINPTTIFSAISNIADLLNNFFPVDVVGIFDSESLQQVFENARPIKAEVRETSMVMKHPVETGTMIADNHIINPIEINLSLFIGSEFYNSVYTQIRQAYIAGTSLSVQTRTGVYGNMIIADMPHTEDTDTFDAVIMALHLTEVIFVVPNSVSPLPTPANFSPRDPVNSNIITAGQKYPSIIANPNITAVRSIFTTSAFKGIL